MIILRIASFIILVVFAYCVGTYVGNLITSHGGSRFLSATATFFIGVCIGWFGGHFVMHYLR